MNESRMCKKPVLVSGDSVVSLKRIPLSNGTFKEVWMQELLEKAPDILPSGHIDGVFAPLICVAREVEVNSGYIDILYISAKGYLVIVETKLWRNPEAKRQVVSQIIDYAKDVKAELDKYGLFAEFVAPRLWFDKRTNDGGFTASLKEDRDFAMWRAKRSCDIGSIRRIVVPCPLWGAKAILPLWR